MASGKRKNNSKNNKNNSRKKVANRVQNALEIAERELNGPLESEEYVKRSNNAKLNGTIVNPFKKQKRNDDSSDDGERYDYGKDFDVDGSDFEDEEIDSDEAFGSDEDLFDAYDSKFSQTVRDLKLSNKKRNRGDMEGNNIDSDVEPDEYTSIDEGDLMPLSAIWDVNEKIDEDDKLYKQKKKTESENGTAAGDDFQLELNNGEEESEAPEGSSEDSSDSESESEESEESEEEDIFGNSSDNEEIELNTVSKKLNSKINKGKKDEHKLLSHFNNNLYEKENEFSPFASKSSNNLNATSNKLDINDLMNVLDADDAKQASLLSAADADANKPMAIPLSKTMQEKNERKVAYDITKEEVSKWQDTVQMLRKSDHIDYSKLNESENAKKVESSAFIQPSSNVRTVLESKVDQVLKDSDLNTMIKADGNMISDISPDNFEDLPVAKMSKEELLKRNQEMRVMRELMFREERKAKRIKKIKSKSYRKIKRKELLRNQELLEDENSEEDVEEADLKRARERMTLKHKNTSKWARDMVKHGMTKDKETRDEMEEMLRQGEQLTNRIHGRDDNGKRKGAQSEGDSDYIDLEKEEDDVEERKAMGKTGVLGMKFMTDAEQRKKEQNRKELEALRRFENGEEEADIFEDQFGEGISKAKNMGRRVYTQAAMTSQKELEAVNDGNEEESATEEKTVEVQNNTSAPKEKEPSNKNSKKETKEKKESTKSEVQLTKAAGANPWLDEASEDEAHVKKSSKVHVIDKDSSKLSKAANKIAKHEQKAQLKQNDKELRGNTKNDPILDIEQSTLNIVDPYANKNFHDEIDDGFQNQDLISQAFAGDDVVSKFEEEKQRVVIDEDDKEVDMTLPGWGGWVGDGVKKNSNKKSFIKKIAGVAKKDKRKDKKLQNVIINERVNKKNLKYQASAVPFPYENKEQYERSLQIPLGPEWSANSTFSKAIKPRALLKKSQIIDPLKKPFT